MEKLHISFFNFSTFNSSFFKKFRGSTEQYLSKRFLFSLNFNFNIRVIIGIQFGAMTAGQVASFAPDYMKAKMAAGRILDLFDRTPVIDSYSDAGSKVCCFDVYRLDKI